MFDPLPGRGTGLFGSQDLPAALPTAAVFTVMELSRARLIAWGSEEMAEA